jgi:hypothetical protein
VIASYLAEVADRLSGSARARRDIVAELEAGLADAADAHRAAGLSPAEAASAAIAEFGRPEQVASGFRAELTAVRARRTAFTLLATGPVIGFLWAGAVRINPPWRWAHWAVAPGGARLAAQFALLALAIAIGSALFTVAASGRLSRWISPWLAARSASSAAIAATVYAAIDLTLLTVLAVLAASTPGRLAALPAAAAAAASLTRLSLGFFAARNCLTTEAARG